MDKESLTPEDSFKIIDKSIANFKMNYRENSWIFLLWGWILPLANISSFIILKILSTWEPHELKAGKWELRGLIILGNWIVCFLIGFIIMYFKVRKMNKKKKVFSHIDKFIDNLWWVTAPSFFIAMFICIRLGISVPPIMMLIAGIATTTTGLVIKFKPLIIGGMSFFIFSIVTTYLTNEYVLLVVSAAIICGYLIPGYYLKAAKE